MRACGHAAARAGGREGGSWVRPSERAGVRACGRACGQAGGRGGGQAGGRGGGLAGGRAAECAVVRGCTQVGTARTSGVARSSAATGPAPAELSPGASTVNTRCMKLLWYCTSDKGWE